MVDPKTSAERLEEREKLLRKLIGEIEGAILDSENLKDHNILALVLLVRAIDILHANYGEADAIDVVNFMISDRRKRRRLPVTEERARRTEEVRKWLP